MPRAPLMRTFSWHPLMFGVASVASLLASACAMDMQPSGGMMFDQAPVAGDDTITTTANTPGSTSVLANDRDPNDDTLAVTSFTQGEHGTVAIANGVATYMPAASFIGPDSFRYTIDDGRGMTATGVVAVMVGPGAPGCTIAVSGPSSGMFGQDIHLTATAACNTGPAEVQWYHKVNSSYVVVQPFSATQTLDIPADVVGNNNFYALVRTQGTTASQGMSNIVSVAAVDNTPQCTAVKMVSPTSTQTLTAGKVQMLTASATCPAGSTPEYQFWVKPTGAANWQILPTYTTGSESWVAPSTGTWSIRAVARTTGSHVSYQVVAMSVTVDVTP